MYVLVVFRILIKGKQTKNRNKNHYNIININNKQNKKSTKYYFSFRFEHFLSASTVAFLKPVRGGGPL